MKKVKITESQRLMLESLDGVKLHEVTNEEIPGIAQNDKTGKYHMALISRDGHIRALEPKLSQFTFDDSQSAKKYFCSNTERIQRVLSDEDMMEGYRLTEDGADFRAVASIDICKVTESIPRSQSIAAKVTDTFNSEAKGIKGFKAESEFETGQADWSDVVSQSHQLLKQLYTNPNKESLDGFWGDHGVSWDDIIQLLTKLDIIVDVKGGYRLTKFVDNPTQAIKVTAKLLMKLIEKKNAPEPVAEIKQDDITPKYLGKDLPTTPQRTGKTREELLKIIAAKRAEELKRRQTEEIVDEDGGYPAGAANDPRAPYNQSKPDMSKPEQPKYDKFDVVAMGKEIVLLKAKDGKLFAYYYLDLDRDELEPYAEREVIDVERDEDGYYNVYDDNWEIDGETIERYVNDNLDYIKVGTEPSDWEEGDKIALVTPEIKQEILNIWGDEEQIAKTLSNIGETTGAAGSSGSYVGSMSKGPAIQPNVASELKDVIGEVEDDKGETKSEIISTLLTLISKNPDPIVWLSYENKLRPIVDKIQTLDNEEWNFLITFIIKTLQSAETSLKLEDKNTEGYDNNMRGLKNFISHFSSSIGEATTTVSAGGDSGTFAYDAPVGDGGSFWTAGNKMNKQMPLVKKGGVNEIKARENKNAKTDTQYPDGKFVEFDDCVKYNNNKVAQNGGCSVGAVDNVVKTKGSKNSVISDSSIYEGVVDEALKLQHDKEKNKLIVLSDLEGRAANAETFTNKNVLKKNGFVWSGKNWVIDADKLDVAKKTLSLINKAEYLIDKLEDIEKAVAGSGADNKDLLTAKLDQYIMDLANATDEAALSAEIRRYLTFFSKFHNYSFYNRMLIFIQRPDAKKVASYKRWQDTFRQVRKGSTGITVLAPIISKSKGDNEEDNESGLGRSNDVRGFRAVRVFDISDTDPIDERGEIPETPEWHSENTPSETADMLFKAVSDLAVDMGVKVTADPSKGGEKGYSAGDHINISSDVEGVGRLSTMVHELAHELMHRKESSIYFIDNSIGGGDPRALKELQAESVSYVVLKHYDIPVKHHTTYLALWNANKEKIQKNLEIISKVSQFIITKIDKEVVGDVKLNQSK